jgi:hypothetical protein
MSRMDYFQQGGTPFDGFLYATLGEDSRGHAVSVLSALARLQLDPWDEAADLADLPRTRAQTRLEGLLARFADVPALARDSAARRLVALLPQSSGRAASPVAAGLPTGLLSVLGPVVALLLLVWMLAQVFLLGVPGMGE